MVSDPESDSEFHEAMAKALTTIPRRRRASSASWSSGQDITVPDTDIEEVEGDLVELRSDYESEDEPVVSKVRV